MIFGAHTNWMKCAHIETRARCANMIKSNGISVPHESGGAINSVAHIKINNIVEDSLFVTLSSPFLPHSIANFLKRTPQK